MKPSMKVLDAGYGTGVVSRMIVSLVLPRKVYETDCDSLFIEKTKTISFDQGIKNRIQDLRLGI